MRKQKKITYFRQPPTCVVCFMFPQSEIFFFIQSNTGKICDCDLRKKVGFILSEKKNRFIQRSYLYYDLDIRLHKYNNIILFQEFIFFSLWDEYFFKAFNLFYCPFIHSKKIILWRHPNPYFCIIFICFQFYLIWT